MPDFIAHAKLNLALHVTGQREDGYHLLDSLVVFTELGDLVSVSRPHHAHGAIAATIDGPFSDGLTAGPENLVTSAAFMLRDAIIRDGGEPGPVEIHLEKNLPLASGIGGGSADAAAALIALQDYWQSECDLETIAKGLGADVPMCLHSTSLRATGTGTEVELLEHTAPMNLLLVNPGIGVSTPDVFAALANKENPPIDLDCTQALVDVSLLATLRNDLQQPAIGLEPEIGRVLELLDQQGALLSRMSGSGATCFGIFNSHEDALTARGRIRSAKPQWWVEATQTTTRKAP